MHLLNVEQSGALYDSQEAVDLDIPPGDIIIMSSADSEVAILARIIGEKYHQPPSPQVRLANYLSLSHPYSVDLFIEKSCADAKLIIVRLLGGTSYWKYGVEQLHFFAREKGCLLLLLPGDGRQDSELDSLSTASAELCARINGYFQAGGPANAATLLEYLFDILKTGLALPPPLAPPVHALLPAGIYLPSGLADKNLIYPGLADLKPLWHEDESAAVVAVIFYRAQYLAGDTEPVDSLFHALHRCGLNPLPIFVASLKDPHSAEILSDLLIRADCAVICNLTSFAVSDPADHQKIDEITTRGPGPFGVVSAPVIQVVLSSSFHQDWLESPAGLNPRDLAMQVVLPELDGRILSRAIGFKSKPWRDQLTGAMITAYRAEAGRADYVAQMVLGWANLRQKPADKRIVALILANYPNRDGRIANGVGLDTPESAFHCLQMLTQTGYDISGLPLTSAGLIEKLKAGPTNQGYQGRYTTITLSVSDYKRVFAELAGEVQEQITQRWGEVADDPMCDGNIFHLPLIQFGKAFIGIQPARGYNIDPKASYHDPALVPPHNYLAFYFKLRLADAIIHFGKHGNLEWLPGKALALSDACLPEAILGPVPHLYPFIVNDPGEGAQAKRRNAAVILDHLTPPMTQAGSYGALAELEGQMDEYYEASGLDRQRSLYLMEDILLTAETGGLLKDCEIKDSDSNGEKLLKLDNFLCDLKELQIRDGLHVFGKASDKSLQDSLIAAILRNSRGDGQDSNASLLRAMSDDLEIEDEFDPLTAERALIWEGARPPLLVSALDNIWRSIGDTVERLDRLAGLLIEGALDPQEFGPRTMAVITIALPAIRAGIAISPQAEMSSLQRGLAGLFIPPGPSGAPTRGRPEILPTGRNFYSLDSRALPTPVAWRIGWASAQALLERHLQDEGAWPQALTLSAWGTANMRTGGDDIAQMMALMGVQPVWDQSSRRVTGFEVMPLSVLDRPRVDVTLRCSGFFRDAFPAQIQLLDRAVRAVSALDEPADMNPIAENSRALARQLQDSGLAAEIAERKASLRIFSTKPGTYGAGLQSLIDEGIWSERTDFADAFLAWSSYGYGESHEGDEAGDMLKERLRSSDGIVHNQDNREHDILDSDDYYQFIGGLSASIAQLKGRDVPIYHSDHSLPEQPRIRSLSQEIGRVVRGRAANPKWIKGVMRHGYRGAFEISATLDYLFAFAATTGQVDDHHFTLLYEAWVDDDAVRDFIAEANPDAWRDILKRFSEAIERGLWAPRRNHIRADLESWLHLSS